MDHIPRPYNAVGAPFEFPHLSIEQYDRGSFLTYPNRKGVESPSAISPGSDTATSWAAFLQTWLFFGLLHEFLEDDYTNDNDWTCVNDAQQIILCTRNLAAVISHHWKERHEKEERMHHLMTCFGRAFEVVTLACEFRGADAEGLISVAILVNLLGGVIRALGGHLRTYRQGIGLVIHGLVKCWNRSKRSCSATDGALQKSFPSSRIWTSVLLVYSWNPRTRNFSMLNVMTNFARCFLHIRL